MSAVNTDIPVLLKLNWSWETSFVGITICDGEIPIGEIPDFSKESVSRIYKREIEVEYQGIAGQHIYFNDPVDNKAWCKYEFDKITSPNRHCIIIDHILCEIVQGKYKPEYKRIAELKLRKNIWGGYKSSGELLFYETSHLEADIFTLFFDLYYKRD